MSNIKERYVSRNTAELLRKHNFTTPCYCYYNQDGNQERLSYEISNFECVDDEIACPTHQMAIDFIRETYGITISIVPTMIDQCQDVCYEALIWVNKTFDQHETSFVGDYGEVVDIAIRYVLTNLI